MPYIEQAARASAEKFPETVGELNYAITHLINDYLLAVGIRYETLNAVDGVLGLAQAEFRRRVVFPYEDEKMEQNGDVYTCLDEPIPLTYEYLQSLKIHDSHGNEANKCGIDCGLKFIGSTLECAYCTPSD